MSLVKDKSKEANDKLSWWKQNKKKKPVKYDALSVLGDSDPKQDSFKWYSLPQNEFEIEVWIES